MKKILLFHLLLICPALYLTWYIAYPGYTWFLESESFFTFTPDFLNLQYSLPTDWAEYAGAYLLQYFRYVGGGPLIQMLFAVTILFSFDWVFWRIFRRKELLWLSFIPVAWFLFGQFEDYTLARSVSWVIVSVMLSLLVWAITCWLKFKPLNVPHFWSASFFVYAVPCFLLGGNLYFLLTHNSYRDMEANCRMERLTEKKDWDAILQIIPPEEAIHSSMKQHFALLALSEKGLLTERLFAYGVTDPSCFLYEHQEQPFCCNFNSYFFEALGLDNEAIHHSFQAGIQAPHGMNFRSMRRMTDAWYRLGNGRMMAKYLEVMEKTSCHKSWLAYKKKHLHTIGAGEQIASNETDFAFFIGAHPFLSDMARCVDRHPNNRKAADYLLCGLLISKDLSKFYSVFSRLNRAPSLPLPRYYEEALILLAQQYPELLQHYSITLEKQREFKNFQALLNGGTMNQQMVKLQFGDSFWFYFYCTGGGGK